MENPIQKDDLGVPPYALFSWVLTGKCLAPVTGDRPAFFRWPLQLEVFSPHRRWVENAVEHLGFKTGLIQNQMNQGAFLISIEIHRFSTEIH